MIKNGLFSKMKLCVLLGLFVVALAAQGAGAVEIVYAEGDDVSALDPCNALGTTTATVISHIFNPLVFADKDGKVGPCLAESYSMIDDTTWEFRLRPGVTFHNGEPFNASTVKFSLERMQNKDLKFRLASDFAIVREVQIVDDHTVRFVTSQPFPELPLRLTYLFMQPEKYITEKGNENFLAHPIGTGAYKFVERRRGDRVILEANENFFAGKPKYDKLTFRVIPEDAARVAALEAGEVDLISSVPTSQAGRLKTDKLEVVGGPSSRVIYVNINTLNYDDFKDKRVRQAMNYAVDVDSIIESIMNGYGRRVATISAPHYFGYADSVTPYTYDPEKAKALLKEAGYKPQSPIRLAVAPGAQLNNREVTQVIAMQLQEVGIPVEVTEKEASLLTSEMLSKKAEKLVFFGIGGPYANLELIARIAFGTDQRYSVSSNPAFDTLREKASVTTNDVEAKALYRQMQEMAKDEAPAIFLYQQYRVYAFNKNKVKDWAPRIDEMILFFNL